MNLIKLQKLIHLLLSGITILLVIIHVSCSNKSEKADKISRDINTDSFYIYRSDSFMQTYFKESFSHRKNKNTTYTIELLNDCYFNLCFHAFYFDNIAFDTSIFKIQMEMYETSVKKKIKNKKIIRTREIEGLTPKTKEFFYVPKNVVTIDTLICNFLNKKLSSYNQSENRIDGHENVFRVLKKEANGTILKYDFSEHLLNGNTEIFEICERLRILASEN